jgi:hypothetical protein
MHSFWHGTKRGISYKSQHTRLPRLRCLRGKLRCHACRWRFGDEHQHLGVGILRQGLQDSTHAVAADTLVHIAPTDAYGLGHA